jgi:pimeloyl-ACP methyl ester carboxylesterase
MTVSTPASTTRTVSLRDGLAVTVQEYGGPTAPASTVAPASTGVLLLHGGAGPRSVAGLAAGLAQHALVVVPTHPGFDGTPRPDWADSVADLAVAYLDLIDELGLDRVLVIGSSIGGWIAAEMGLFDNHGRISALVLIDAVGIRPEPPLEIADPAVIGPVRTGELAFYNPAFRLDPAALSDEQKATAAVNQRTQAVYSGDGYDPKLRGRLHRVTAPVLVLTGEQDGIVPPAYARALAGAFPRATFRAIAEAGHFPHMEQPGAVLAALGDFVDAEVKP